MPEQLRQDAAQDTSARGFSQAVDSSQVVDPALDRFASAYWGLVKGVQEAWFPPALQERAQQTQNELREAATDARKQYEISRAWSESVAQHGSSSKISERLKSAYDNYARELQHAWSSVDPSSLTPAHLVAIAQSVQTAAWYAAWLGAGRR